MFRVGTVIICPVDGGRWLLHKPDEWILITQGDSKNWPIGETAYYSKTDVLADWAVEDPFITWIKQVRSGKPDTGVVDSMPEEVSGERMGASGR